MYSLIPTRVLTCLLCGLSSLPTAFAKDGPSPSDVYFTTSTDGLRFTQPRLLAVNAGAPTITVLPDGRLAAAMDVLLDPHGGRATAMVWTLSQDGGRTWSPLKPIRIARGDRSRRNVGGHHPEWVRTPDGKLRLLFVDAMPHRKDHGRISMLRMAGAHESGPFALDEQFRTMLRCGEDGRNVHARAAILDDALHVFGDTAGRSEERTFDHLVSTDLRDFDRIPARRPRNVVMTGSVDIRDQFLRAYVDTPGGVGSMISRDAKQWKMEDGTRMIGGAQASVAKNPSTGYVALFCRPSEPGREQALAVPGDDLAAGILPVDTAVAPQGDIGVRGLDANAVAQAQLESGYSDDHTEAGAAEAPLADDDDTATAMAEVIAGADGFVPPPDFSTRFNYFDYFLDQQIGNPSDNAYAAYDAFMDVWDDSPGGWPVLNDMFNGGEHEGPPIPWNPEDHAAWDETYHAVQPLLEQYREATWHTSYALIPDDEYMRRVKGESERPLLINLLLPSLSKHRHLMKAEMAAAWRAPNGTVDADVMINAFGTVLRNSGHLQQGATLIEELVGMAGRNVVYDNARWALQQGAIPAERLPEALRTLMNEDPGLPEPGKAIRAEHAMTMDTVQHLFMPEPGNGPPSLRREALPEWFESNKDMLEEFDALSPEEIRQGVEDIDGYYRELESASQIGYPTVRGADLDAIAEKYVDRSPVTRALVPHLGMIHRLRARSEATRRATQLGYATHIYHDRHGRWPESLGEIGAEFGTEMTVDPFTGTDFGYRIEDEGPYIYSRGENGLDDGGVHAPHWDVRPDPATGSDDTVFWPPQQ